MTKKISYSIIVILISLLAAPLFSYEGEAYHGSYFMKLKPGARANSMGLAYLGFSDDNSALFWNPAGPVTLTSSGFDFGAGYLSYQNYIANVGMVFKSSSFAMGFGALGFQYPSIPKYDVSGNPTGSLNNLQGFGLMNVSFLLTDFSSMGFNFKAGYQKIEDKTFYAGSGSLGLMAQFLYFQLVLNVNDMGTTYDQYTKKYQFMNPDFNFAVSYTKLNNDDERTLGASFALSRGLDLPNDETKIGVGGFIRIWSSNLEMEDFFSKKKRQTDAFYLNLGFENYHGISFRGGFTIIFFGVKTDIAFLFPTKSDRDFSIYGSIEINF